MESKLGNLNLYDKLMADVVANVLNEASRTDNKIYLKWFDPDYGGHKTYFYGALIASDVCKMTIYLDMPFFKYLKFKLSNWKRRKQIKWVRQNKVPLAATPIQEIIDHLEVFHGLRPEANQIWYDILIKYYEPKKGEKNESNCN